MEINKILLSDNTISRTFFYVSTDIKNNIIDRLKISKWFALQVDESSDIIDETQILTFIPFVDITIMEYFVVVKNYDIW